uniref:Predicted gene 45261 n=1 Tax=Nannospalax galili TaxID=1026970 RepID=A0A8C6RZ23_NANGA
MEANIQLMRVIREMRAEINALEKENHTLRVKLTSISQTASGSGGESDEREEAVRGQSPATLPDSFPTDSTPAVRELRGNAMIVRRYSISPSVHSYAANDPWKARNRLPCSRTSLASSIKKQDSEEKMLASDSRNSNSSSQRAPPEQAFVCRDKTKTVSFHLPRDMSSFSKNSSSANQNTNQLSITAEKGM